MKKIFLIVPMILVTAKVFADPQLTSWLTDYSGQYARVYTTTANRTSGISATTWANQSVVTYSDIAQVLYSANWIYVRSPDLPSYVMGPSLNPQGAVGNFWPTNQHDLNRFPRSPLVQSGTKTISGTGYSGIYVDGIAVFNFTDGKAWNPTNSSVVSGPHNQGTYYWHRNAPVGEGYNFDYGLGHQNPAGVYHTHQQPIALRYQLGDYVDFNSSTKNYSESSSTNLAHSPIVGWAYDGYPIYGPYGYSVSNNASSGVRRLVSGYVQRDGKNGTDNLTNNLTTIPAWYARFRQAHFGGTYSTTTTQARASVSGTNTLGTYAEDYSYYGDLTNSATGQKYVMGTNTFDLDEYNGRYCVTPEFPSGTYAYFLTIDASGTSAYPYAIAYEYYGTASGGSVSSISEAVTTNFTGSADSALTQSTPSVSTNYVVTLTWTSTEGGTYQVESSTNSANWVTQVASVGAQSKTNYTSSSFTNPVTSGTSYARVTRTALATYDPVGGGSGVVAQTNVISFLVANSAPVVANPISTQTATYGSSFSFTFATNVFTDADAGQTLTYTASSSALTNTAIAFNAATRTFSATAIDATNGGTIAGSYSVAVVATDDGSPAKSATNTFTLTINKTAASVTANSFTRSYGATNPVFTGTLSNFVAADSITGNYACTAATNSGTQTLPITATLSDPGTRLGNYIVTTNNGTLTITNAIITVTASNLTRSYGVTNPTFTVSYAGYLNGYTFATTTTGSPVLTCAATTNSAVGSYVITNSVGTLSADNYTFVTVNGSLTVTQTALTVTMNSTNRTYGATNPVFTGSLSGLKNNDAISVSGGSTSATTNSAPGTYSITPAFTDPGSKLGNYAVTTNIGTLTISKATLAVTANSTNRAYSATNPVFTATYTGFVNGETTNSGTVSGAPALVTSAATNSVTGSYGITNSTGSLASAYYSFTFTNGTLTVTAAALTVTASNFSRAYGTTNPTFAGLIAGLQNNDNVTANYSTTATTNSPVGSYPILVTLNDPNSRLGNYSVTTNQGTLTVTNLNGASNYTVTLTSTNSLVNLGSSGTQDYTFTDAASGLAVVVRLTMTAYSASNASPAFTTLDYYASVNRSVHLGVDSGLSGGDGNFASIFEGANFAATLLSASSGIATNSIKFGITGVGFRFSPKIVWNSSVLSNSVTSTNNETLYTMDTGTVSLVGTNYTATVRSASNSGDYQFSDFVDGTNYGLALKVSFYVGTNYAETPTLASSSYAAGKFSFSITGTTGSSYVVQVTTNLASGVWSSIYTNVAPFNFTNTSATSDNQRFFRVTSQ